MASVFFYSRYRFELASATPPFSRKIFIRTPSPPRKFFWRFSYRKAPLDPIFRVLLPFYALICPLKPYFVQRTVRKHKNRIMAIYENISKLDF